MPDGAAYYFNEINAQKNIAYKRASNIFRVGAYIYVGLCLLIWGLSITLLVRRDNFNLATGWETLTKPTNLMLLAVVIIYLITSEYIKGRSRSSIIAGKVVAALSLALFPVGTIIGAIALVRLINKNL